MVDLVDITEDMSKVNVDIREEQELTNEKLDSILALFEKIFEDQARARLDLLELERERQAEERRRQANAEQEEDSKKRGEDFDKSAKSLIGKLLSGLAGLGLGALIYNSVREALNLPKLTTLMSGTFDKVAKLIRDSAYNMVLDVERGKESFSEKNPEAVRIAAAAAVTNVPNYLLRENLKTPTAGQTLLGTKGPVTTTGVEVADGRVQVKNAGGTVYTISREEFIRIGGETKAPLAKPSILTPEGISTRIQEIAPESKIAGKAAGAVKAIPIAGQVATVAMGALEYDTRFAMAEQKLKESNPELTEKQLQALASYVAQTSTIAYTAGAVGDLVDLGLDLGAFLGEKAGVVTPETAQKFYDFVPSAEASEKAFQYQLDRVTNDMQTHLDRLQAMESARIAQGDMLNSMPSQGQNTNITIVKEGDTIDASTKTAVQMSSEERMETSSMIQDQMTSWYTASMGGP